MRGFDIKRFGRLLKWIVLTDRKKITNLVGGMVIGCTVAFVPQMLFGDLDTDAAQMSVFTSIIHGLGVVFTVSLLICGSWIFCNMGSKQGRIEYMMLPATMPEKYIARWLLITVGVALCWFAAFCVADAIRIMVSLFTGRSPMVWGVPVLFNVLFNPDFSNTIFYSPIFSSYNDALGVMMIHSVFVLGGTVFNRRQFVFTSAVVLGFMICMAWGIFLIHEHVPLHLSSARISGVIYYLSFYVPVIVTLLCFWCSYRVFRRMQVINNKWINL